MYSAIQKDGVRLYDLARKGKEVERESRFIALPLLELLSFEAPRGKLRVRCSKGTYIRTLCHDLGPVSYTHLAGAPICAKASPVWKRPSRAGRWPGRWIARSPMRSMTPCGSS